MKKALLVFMALVILATMPACATILHGDRCGSTYKAAKIDMGMLVLDIVLLGGLGLVVDFLTGAIWVPVDAPSGDYEVAPAGADCIGGQYYKNSETGEIIYIFPQKIDDNEKIQHVGYSPITG